MTSPNLNGYVRKSKLQCNVITLLVSLACFISGVFVAIFLVVSERDRVQSHLPVTLCPTVNTTPSGISNLAAAFLKPASTCIHQVLDVNNEAAYGKFPTDFQAVALSNVKVHILSDSQATAQFSYCDNQTDHITEFGVGVELTIKEEKDPALNRQCDFEFEQPVVVFNRVAPLVHFGHRMLTDWPALYSIRKYLLKAGIDLSNVTVVYMDNKGLPVFGPPNFEPILNSTGWERFNAFTPQDNGPAFKDSIYCFKQAVFIRTKFWQKYFVEKKKDNLWSTPDMLFDVDALAMEMVGSVRKYLGLSPSLQFAPIENRKLVIASRDPELRKMANQSAKRLFLNENELVAEMKNQFPDLDIVQVEFSTLTAIETIQLLDKASVLMGYHGAALDFTLFLPRGAFMIEILPSGTNHPPLYPQKAATTGKFFMRYVNHDLSRQFCCRNGEDPCPETCNQHNADLNVDIPDLINHIRIALDYQQIALQRHPGMDY